MLNEPRESLCWDDDDGGAGWPRQPLVSHRYVCGMGVGCAPVIVDGTILVKYSANRLTVSWHCCVQLTTADVASKFQDDCCLSRIMSSIHLGEEEESDETQ